MTAGLALVACTAAAVPAGAQTGVTRAEAEAAAEAFQAANDRNNATLNVEGQGAIESPPIRAIDDATFREYRGRGETTLGQDIRIEDRKLYVTDQAGYPRRFLSSERVAFDGAAATRQLLLFEQGTEGAPWKVSMAAQIDNGPIDRIAVDSDGRARFLTERDRGRLFVQPHALAPKLARFWDSGRSTSKTFDPGPWTTGANDVLVQSLRAASFPDSNGVFTPRAAETRPVCFATARRGALCFFVVTVRERLRPAERGPYVQPSSREPLGGLVAPGEYREVRYDVTAILVASVPPKSHQGARVVVNGAYHGVTSAEGVPADSSQPV